MKPPGWLANNVVPNRMIAVLCGMIAVSLSFNPVLTPITVANNVVPK